MPEHTNIPTTFTAHTLIPDTELSEGHSLYDFFNDMGHLYGHIKRTLFKDSVRKGKPLTSFKNDYLKWFGITARQFNSVRVDLQGNIGSHIELLNMRITETEARIRSIKKWLKNKEASIKKIRDSRSLSELERQNSIYQIRFNIHQKKRKLYAIETKLSLLKTDRKVGKVRICFGSKALYRKQFNLSENGYVFHEEWLEDWRGARSSNFFFLGSKDETSGNQTSKLTPSGEVYIRVPDSLILKYGKHIKVSGIRYPYGQDMIDNALKEEIALSHRFVRPVCSGRDKKGWYLHTSVEIPKKDTVRVKPGEIGCISVDFNEKEVAVVETDRFGNLVWHETYPACVRDKTTEQTRAIYGDISKKIVERCVETGRPLGHERLDFQQKKSARREGSVRYARMLSRLAYTSFLSMLDRRAYKCGVDVYTDNPAYSSVIGKWTYMAKYGISPHESAAFVIGRRIQRYSEIPSPSRTAFPLPVRNRGKHVWSFWRRLKDSGAVANHHMLYLQRSLQDSTGSAELTAPSFRTPVPNRNKASDEIHTVLTKTVGLHESG